MKIRIRKDDAGPLERSTVAAFNRAELLVTVSVISVFVLLHAVASPHAKGQSETAVCLNNLRRLATALFLYTRDNQDLLPGNKDGGLHTNETWCSGWLDYTGNRDNTNWVDLMNSQLGRYAGSRDIYKCPADHSLTLGVSGIPRVRSISMNCYVGQLSPGRPYTAGYRNFKSVADFADPGPSRIFTFIDEREDSINDACFAVSMDGYTPSLPFANELVDMPADWHDRGCNLSFADGHVENWHWQDARTTPPHTPGQLISLGVGSPTNMDVTRLQDASSRRKP